MTSAQHNLIEQFIAAKVAEIIKDAESCTSYREELDSLVRYYVVPAVTMAAMQETVKKLEAQAGPLFCDRCGEPMLIDGRGVSNHIDDDGNIDYKADAGHVAYNAAALEGS